MWLSTGIARVKEQMLKRREARVDLAGVEVGARRVFNDCVAFLGDEDEKRPDDDVPLVAVRPPVCPRRAAVQLVTLVEARARSGGLFGGRGVARADHSVALSLDATLFCTVSALAGELFVDPVGPAPMRPVSLRFSEKSERFEPIDPAAWPDPIAFLAVEIARYAPTPAAAAMILGFTAG